MVLMIPVTPPAQRVQFILGELDHDENSHEPHPLFSEMEELLCDADGEMEWKETARFEPPALRYISFEMFEHFFSGGSNSKKTWKKVATDGPSLTWPP